MNSWHSHDSRGCPIEGCDILWPLTPASADPNIEPFETQRERLNDTFSSIMNMDLKEYGMGSSWVIHLDRGNRR